MPDIMILAQAVSRYFVDKIALLHKMPKSEKGHNSVKYINRNLHKLTRSSTHWIQSVCSAQAVLQIFC